MGLSGKRLTVGMDEDGHTLYWLDGKLMDLVRYENRAHALGSLLGDGIIINEVGAVGKFLSGFFRSAQNLQLFKSVSNVLGESYEAVAYINSTIKNTTLLKALNSSSKGNWVKVYEAGILDGKKVEVHYFKNLINNRVFDVKIKYPYWHQKQFKKF